MFYNLYDKPTPVQVMLCGTLKHSVFLPSRLQAVQMVLVEIAPCHLCGCAQGQAAGEEFPHLVGAGFRCGEATRGTRKELLPS